MLRCLSYAETPLPHDDYDFSGDEPADEPRYVRTDEHHDFTGEEMGPPPVLGLGEPVGGWPKPLSVARFVVDAPFRLIDFLDSLTSSGDPEDDATDSDDADTDDADTDDAESDSDDLDAGAAG